MIWEFSLPGAYSAEVEVLSSAKMLLARLWLQDEWESARLSPPFNLMWAPTMPSHNYDFHET